MSKQHMSAYSRRKSTVSAVSTPAQAQKHTEQLSNVVMVGPHFRIGHRIGRGNFGEVRLGQNLYNNEYVAIKLEPLNVVVQQLLMELKWYRMLGSAEGIPQVYYSETSHRHTALVMELLGPSLESLFNKCSRKFTFKTTTMIAIQLLNRFSLIHSRQLIYRDVKPDNFLIGRRRLNKDRTIYVVDFGLSREYIVEGEHIAFQSNRNITGTIRYVSINTHLGIEQSRRDDLESLAYMFIYFLRGSLPWQGIKAAATPLERFKRIAQCKAKTSVDQLCTGLPEEFASFLRYAKSLQFDESPNYAHLKGLFSGLMKRSGWSCDWEFDWINVSVDPTPEDSLEALDLVQVPSRAQGVVPITTATARFDDDANKTLVQNKSMAGVSMYSRRQSLVVDWDALRCPDDDTATLDTVTGVAAGTRSVSNIARRTSVQAARLPSAVPYRRPKSRVRAFFRRLCSCCFRST